MPTLVYKDVFMFRHRSEINRRAVKNVSSQLEAKLAHHQSRQLSLISLKRIDRFGMCMALGPQAGRKLCTYYLKLQGEMFFWMLDSHLSSSIFNERTVMYGR